MEGKSYLTQIDGGFSPLDAEATRKQYEEQEVELHEKMLRKEVGGIKKGIISRFDREKEIDEILKPVMKFVWHEQREKAINLCRGVIITVFDGLREGQIEDSQAKRYIQILLDYLGHLPASLLSELGLNLVNETLEPSNSQPENGIDGCIFELLPKILNTLLWEEEIDLDGLELGKMSGLEFQSHVVKRLCDLEWPANLQLPLLSNLRDLEVSPAQLKELVKKAVESMKVLPWTDIPNAAYHLLVLSTKGEQTLILQSILAHINHIGENHSEENAVSAEDLLNIQSTTLHHIEFACQQNQNLPSALLLLIKRREETLTPFTLAVLLTIARTRRFEELILKFIHRYSADYHKLQIKGKESVHIETVLNHQENPFFVDLKDVIQTCVQHGSVWNDILEPLVKVALQMLASGECPVPLTDPLHHNLKQRIHSHGAEILIQIFRQDERSRRHIVEQLLFRLMNPEEKNLMGVLQILKVMIRERTTLLINDLNIIKESIDCITYLPWHLSREFILAVAPIYHLQADFRNYLQIVLRKLIFKKDVNSRCTAIQGFYTIIANTKDEVVEESPDLMSSQVQGSSSKVLSMFLECLNIFKRTMTQQVEVRICTYHALGKLSHRHPILRPYILDLFQKQILKYDSGDSEVFPFRLKKCLDRNHCVLEPLPELLGCCLRALIDVEPNATYGRDFQGRMSRIIKRLGKSRLNEMDYDLETESMTANLTFRNSMIFLIRGCIEAAIEVCIHDEGFVPEYSGLMTTYNDLQSVIDEKPQKAKPVKSQKKSQKKENKQKKVRGKAIKQEALDRPVLAMKSLSKLMGMLTNSEYELSKVIMNNNGGLDGMTLMFSYCQAMKAFAWFKKHESILDEESIDCMIKAVSELFPTLCLPVSKLAKNAKAADEDKTLLPFLEAMRACTDFADKFGKLREVMKGLDFGEELSENETTRKFMEHIHRFVKPAINRNMHKHVCVAIALLMRATHLLVDDSDAEETKANLTDMSGIIENFCSHQIENTKVVRSLLDYHILVGVKSGEHSQLDLIFEIGGCLRSAAGRANATQEDVSEKECINEKTSADVCKYALSKIEQEVAWLEDSISFIKLLAPYQESEYEVERQYISLPTRSMMINKTFGRLRNLATISKDLCKCDFDRGVIHAILRTMIKLFKCVCSADRMLIESKMPVTKKFQKLCKEVFILGDCIADLKRECGRRQLDMKKLAMAVKSEKSIFPTLSFYMEQHDNMLIKFQNDKKRVSDKIDLKQFVKRRQMMSFKILQENILDHDDQEDDNEEPLPKKRKRKKSDLVDEPKKKRLRSQIADVQNNLTLPEKEKQENEMELEEELSDA